MLKRIPESFKVEVNVESDRVLIAPHGELDMATIPQVETKIAEARSEGHKTIVLDLRNLAFMDSSGLRLMLIADSEARKDGYSFAIIDGPAVVQQVLEVTGTSKRFERAQP